MREIERIQQAYERRAIRSKQPHLLMEGELYMYFSREIKTVEMLKKNGMDDLSDKYILDIGCSTGSRLRDFLKWGGIPENLFGIDIVERYIKKAVHFTPNFNYVLGNAENLPFPSDTFDIISQHTAFSSILQSEMKVNIAREMIRALKPEGVILWFDFAYDNPKNKDVKGIKKKEIIGLFPNCSFTFHKIILAPPISRRLSRTSIVCCQLLEKISFLCSHYLVLIKKSQTL